MLYTYDNENITPFSYTVTLDEPDIDVHFIPAERSGLFAFQFNKDCESGFNSENNWSGRTCI